MVMLPEGNWVALWLSLAASFYQMRKGSGSGRGRALPVEKEILAEIPGLLTGNQHLSYHAASTAASVYAPDTFATMAVNPSLQAGIPNEDKRDKRTARLVSDILSAMFLGSKTWDSLIRGTVLARLEMELTGLMELKLERGNKQAN